MPKLDKPFLDLYTFISPKDFIVLFGSELPQTIAFILSFCPHKSFVRKVMHLLDEKEKGIAPLERASFTIREYLFRCCDDTFDSAFVFRIDEQVSTMIKDYKSFSRFRRIRKKLFFKHPKDVVKALEESEREHNKQIAKELYGSL